MINFYKGGEILDKLWCIISIFLIIFSTKMKTVVDIPLIIASFNFLIYLVNKKKIEIPRKLIRLQLILLFFAIYSGVITIINGSKEIIWLMKFTRTFLMFFLLYFSFRLISRKFNYNEFIRVLIFLTCVHSVIIIMCIIFPTFAIRLYSITGYVPRGPLWSRSPGMTISFNAIAIVHVTALKHLIIGNYISNKYHKRIMILVIVISLIFLGRFISYIGLALIAASYLISNRKKIVYFVMIFIGVVVLNSYIYSIEHISNTTLSNIIYNYKHMVDPIVNSGNESSASNQYMSILKDHFYLSNKWNVFLFGNSQSGHMGLFFSYNNGGDTNSDLGIINAINANGIFITIMMIGFYLLIIYESRKRDLESVSFIVILTLLLTFKETGFFDSHATQLMIFTFYFQAFEFQVENTFKIDKKQLELDRT